MPVSEAAIFCSLAADAGVPARLVGSFTGDTLTLGEAKAPMADLSNIWRNSFAAALT